MRVQHFFKANLATESIINVTKKDNARKSLWLCLAHVIWTKNEHLVRVLIETLYVNRAEISARYTK